MKTLAVQAVGADTSLIANPNRIFPRCNSKGRPIDGRSMTYLEIDGTKLDMEVTLCYLGDMLGYHGGCDRAIVARCCVAKGKVRKLLPVLTHQVTLT